MYTYTELLTKKHPISELPFAAEPILEHVMVVDETGVRETVIEYDVPFSVTTSPPYRWNKTHESAVEAGIQCKAITLSANVVVVALNVSMVPLTVKFPEIVVLALIANVCLNFPR